MSSKKIFVLLIAAVLLLSATPLMVSADAPQKVKVIIGFENQPNPQLIKNHGGEIKHQYSIIDAIAAEIPENAIEALQKNPNVKYVEYDGTITMLGEVVPWGVDRIDADLAWAASTGTGVKVAVIDTGIDKDHPDLLANIKGGKNFVATRGNVDPDKWDDDNGHGTHCAGIIAAVDNEEGVIGVAKETGLYGVKVLDRRGSGSLSDVIDGIQWSIDNDMDVISMSLGTSSDYKSLHDACNAAWGAGIVVVAAAGNEGDGDESTIEYSYPAAYDSVIAVAATDSSDGVPYWSNSGPYVELAAPGKDIYSTYKGGVYKTLSGTSMACPHVSGVAALVLASPVDPTYDGNNNNQWDNDEVRQKMDDTAENLGDSGRDNLYGYGLVDAEAAAGPPPDKHDVAITSISAPSSVLIGDTANINVTVANEGTYNETTTVNLTDTYDEILIGSQNVTLSAGGSTIVTFTWDTTGEALGDHVLEANASVVTGETETADNSMTTTVNVYNQSQQADMWVSDISWRTRQAGPNVFLYYTVTVTSTGGPVSSATVYSTLTGPDGTWTYSGITDSNGQVEFSLKKASPGTYTAKVTGITHATYIYKPLYIGNNPSSTYTF